ncbi:hypothetical protein LTR37_010981 [Vermiconidia calcicola]|uniref:Uncharacterized protein n=1 Tax=Vermiconidia calcicola TaxID=1690605 RepID=A0ACC3N3F0_9PEZI|nr:hypothetical protein LTR37_010981 [Vermiconidia calcicola]
MDLSAFPRPPRLVREKVPRHVNIRAASACYSLDQYSPSRSTPNLMSFSSSPSLLSPMDAEPFLSPQFALNEGQPSYNAIHESRSATPNGATTDRDVEDPMQYGRPSTNHSRRGTSYFREVLDLSRPGPSYSVSSMNSSQHILEPGSPSIWLNKNVNELPTGTKSVPAFTERNEKPMDQPSTDANFTPRDMLFIFNICLAQSLSLAGLAQTFAPLLILSDALGVTNPGVMAWPTAAYSLTLGSCILPAGRLGDMFGHKKILFIGWIWFSFFSLICGFSLLGGIKMLTACRAVQGMGPALLIPNGLALFGRTSPMGMKRNLAISFFGASGPCGVVSGDVFSSLLGQLAWWPWSFWIMGIVGFFVSALTHFVIPTDNIKSYLDSSVSPWQRFDVLGATTGVGGLVLINFALNQAPIDGWSAVYIGVLLGLGVLLMVAFIYIESRVADRPLIPIKGLHRDAAFTLACIAAGWGSHGTWSYSMFLLLEQVRGYSALGACSLFWPVAPIGVGAALAVGYLLRKIKVAHLMSISMFCFMAGCLLLATVPAEQSYFPNTFLSVIITPFGMNWSFPTGVMLMSNAVPREHQGIAASLVSTLVNYSISTGLGLAGSIDRYVGEYGLLAGSRGPWYFGIGLAGLGWLISLYFIWHSKGKR